MRGDPRDPRLAAARRANGSRSAGTGTGPRGREAAADADVIPDLGILKTLTSVGDWGRKSVTAVASRLSSISAPADSTNAGHGKGKLLWLSCFESLAGL